MQDAEPINYNAYLVVQANYPVTISYEPKKIPLGLYVHGAGLLVNLR